MLPMPRQDSFVEKVNNSVKVALYGAKGLIKMGMLKKAGDRLEVNDGMSDV